MDKALEWCFIRLLKNCALDVYNILILFYAITIPESLFGGKATMKPIYLGRVARLTLQFLAIPFFGSPNCPCPPKAYETMASSIGVCCEAQSSGELNEMGKRKVVKYLAIQIKND